MGMINYSFDKFYCLVQGQILSFFFNGGLPGTKACGHAHICSLPHEAAIYNYWMEFLVISVDLSRNQRVKSRLDLCHVPL